MNFCNFLVIDCGVPEAIPNGKVQYASTTVDSVALHACTSGYKLIGSMLSVCEGNGEWSTAAFCEG